MQDPFATGGGTVNRAAGAENGSVTKENEKNHGIQTTAKTYQRLQNPCQNGKTPESGLNSDEQDQIHKPSGAMGEGDLHALQKQIELLTPIDRNEAKLRFESEAYVCRKRRNNLFRAFEKKIEKPEFLNEFKSLTLDTLSSRKRPVTKTAIKVEKAVTKLLEKSHPDSKSSGLLELVGGKTRFPIQNFNKAPDGRGGYTETQFVKIRKYQSVADRIPPMNFVFNQENVRQQEQAEQVNEQNEKSVNEEPEDIYDSVPELTGYINPQEPLPRVFSDSKRQIFKLARTFNRMRMEREGVLKRMAYVAVKEVEKRYQKSVKCQNQFVNRAKKLQRECTVYWRKREKELVDYRKRKEKLQAELKKREEEELEATRQEKRLQYIMYQSGLYSHFMATKLGMDGEPIKEGKADEVEKKVEIDEEAAQLAVNQIINSKASNMENFRKPEKASSSSKLDLSSVDQGNTKGELTGPAPSFVGKLKDYQVKGLKWLNNLFEQGINGILADEMGLGKTIQAIALLSHISYHKNVWGPFLIVAPNSTLFNWEQEFKKFCPTLRVLPYWGSIKQRKTIRRFFSDKKFTEKVDSPFHVVITSYQLTVVDEKAFKRLKWQFMILDEAQAIKNVFSQRWNTLKEFQARNRLLMTGTPIQNNMAQLWALLNFIMPELFDSHELFNEWFSKDIEAHSQDQKVLDQIKIQRLHAILKPFMLRRVKKDVEHQIGKKIQQQIMCQMTKRQKILYDSIKEKLNVKEFFKMLESRIKVENLMNLVMQLRKVCNHPQLFERRPPKSPFLFQELYYYTGYIPIKLGQIKLIGFNSKNPIVYNLPKLVYEDCLKYSEPLWRRNKRLLNIYTACNQQSNKTFSATRLLGLSETQVQICTREDLIITRILLAHWLVNSGYNQNLSTKQNLGFVMRRGLEVFQELQRCSSFVLPKEYPRSIINAYIISTTAPTIIPNICSSSFYNQYDLIANNTFHKYLLEGRYKQYWSAHRLAIPEKQDRSYRGLLPNRQQLTKLQVVDFGSLIADSAKLRQLDRILKEKKKNGDRALIFCQMTKMLDILQDFMNMRKYTFFRLDGGSNLADRRDMVNQFQVNSKIFVFLLSTRAGGLGVTLTAANTVIFYDNDWNPTMDAQATDRAHRIGQRSDVWVYQLVTKNTIQERIVKRAEQKKTVQTTVYEGASFNFFKKDMIIELINDQFSNGGDEKKKEPAKKKGQKKMIKEDVELEKEKVGKKEVQKQEPSKANE